MTASTMTSSIDRLREMFAAVLPFDVEDIQPTSHIVDDLGMSSLERVMLLARIETEFQITVAEGEAERLRTVGDVAALIDRHRASP